MSDVEKLANYDKLKTELEKEKSKSEYWKNEHEMESGINE